MNNKNYLLAGGIALIVLMGGYFLLNGSKQDQSTQTQTESTGRVEASPTVIIPSVVVPTESTTGAKMTKSIDIEYTKNGFVPQSVTVKEGTIVTWTNEGGGSMWVASAPHPAHTALPGFDQLKSVGKDGTYSYTFAKVGSWKYHNHVGPSDTGVVVVEN